MVERPDEAHALVKIFLCQRRACRDLAVERSEPFEQLRSLGPAGNRVRHHRHRIMRLGEGGLRKTDSDRCGNVREDGLAHAAPPCETPYYANSAIPPTAAN